MLAAVLVTAAMTFSWRYFRRVATYYHALMLIFLAGMTGFCLTGDIFDLFVWFEVMGVAAYALTAYRPEERGSLQGALTFAITNSVGAYLSLSGIGLIYGRTGALNMAQIGADIGRHPPNRLVVVAFLLIISGLLIKSAIVPFHFWLADAHAVAPTPVCVLLSGVMVELGLYGIARVYWSVFGQALGQRAALSHLFLALGVLTAVVGALFWMSFWVMIDDSIATDELLAGAGAAALAAMFAEVVTYQAGTRFHMRIRWLVPAFRLPGQVARDLVIVYGALWRRLVHGEQPPGAFVELPARFGDGTPEGVTRRTLLVGGTSLAPNTFVLGIDSERDVMVVHRLVAGREGPEGRGRN